MFNYFVILVSVALWLFNLPGVVVSQYASITRNTSIIASKSGNYTTYMALCLQTFVLFVSLIVLIMNLVIIDNFTRNANMNLSRGHLLRECICKILAIFPRGISLNVIISCNILLQPASPYTMRYQRSKLINWCLAAAWYDTKFGPFSSEFPF